MAVKNLQSVVCNVANLGGNVTNLDGKGCGVAMYLAMSSPQFPAFSYEPTKPGLRRERDTERDTSTAAEQSGSQSCWAGTTGYRGTELSTARSWAEGNQQRFPGHIRSRAMFAADSADRDDAADAIRFESLAGLAKA